MTYTQYTIKRQKPLAVLYRCSHCDKIALQMVSLKVNVGYNDKGIFTPAGVEKRAKRADALGAEKMNEWQYALKSGRDSSVFAKAQLKTSSPCCGKREPWAQMDLNWLDNIACVAVFAAIVCFGLLENTQYGLIGLGVALGVFLLRLGCQQVLKSRIEAQMLKCPPLFDDDLEKLQQRAARVQGYADADWDALTKGLFTQIAGMKK